MLANQLHDALRENGSVVKNAKQAVSPSTVSCGTIVRLCVAGVSLTVLAVLVLSSAVLTSECTDYSSLDSPLLWSAADAVLRGQDLPVAEHTRCRMVTLLGGGLSLAVRAMATAIIVNIIHKLLQSPRPQPSLLLSNKMTMRLRDGRCVLQSRYMSAQGHSLLDISATMTSYVVRRTVEGESFLETKALTADTSHRAGCLPTSITHEISSSCPLFGLRAREFSVDVQVKAFDERLGEIVYGSFLYAGEDISVGHEWESPFIVSPKAVLEDTSLVVTVDAAKIGAVKALAEPLRQQLTTQIEHNRAAKLAALKRDRRRIHGVSNTDFEDPVVEGDTVSGFVRSIANQEYGFQRPVLQEHLPEGNILSPISALTSPTYTPPPAVKRHDLKRFKMPIDGDFSDENYAGNGEKSSRKIGKFSSFFKR